MIKNSMSLKAKINNIAREEKVALQAIIQTYMLERLGLKNEEDIAKMIKELKKEKK